MLSTEALQALMAAVCRTYAAQVEAGDELLPLPAARRRHRHRRHDHRKRPAKSANLAVFELGMWQSWTGR